ncbi:hypothetical protein TNCV_4887561 [Trichonephila clavipes]|nr:hypothetical protein TNCV_4887561 [Trichonephila clavipes]
MGRCPAERFNFQFGKQTPYKSETDPQLCLDSLQLLRDHGFVASKATDHDVVDDETENNNTNPITLVVENQHINPPEEPETYGKC